MWSSPHAGDWSPAHAGDVGGASMVVGDANSLVLVPTTGDVGGASMLVGDENSLVLVEAKRRKSSKVMRVRVD